LRLAVEIACSAIDGDNKSRAARAFGRTYRWLRKLESEMTEPKSPSNTLDKRK